MDGVSTVTLSKAEKKRLAKLNKVDVQKILIGMGDVPANQRYKGTVLCAETMQPLYVYEWDD